MNKKRLQFIFVLATIVLLCGCRKKVQEKTIYLVGKDISAISEVQKEDVVEQAEVRNMAICFVNRLGVDIGMISVIDPVTGEQVNVDALADGETILIGSNMPKEIKELDWAIYNSKGELYSESTTDISAANDSVWIVLKGDKAVDEIQVLFDKSEDEIEAEIQ